MIEVSYSVRFLRSVKKLETSLLDEIYEKIELLKKQENHSRLKVHKLQGKLKDCLSFSVNYKIRIIFEYGKTTKEIVLLGVGSHDQIY